jgi:hypothetical protein
MQLRPMLLAGPLMGGACLPYRALCPKRAAACWGQVLLSWGGAASGGQSQQHPLPSGLAPPRQSRRCPLAAAHRPPCRSAGEPAQTRPTTAVAAVG